MSKKKLKYYYRIVPIEEIVLEELKNSDPEKLKRKALGLYNSWFHYHPITQKNRYLLHLLTLVGAKIAEKSMGNNDQTI